MARFTQYPAASIGDYADATTFLIANSDGEIKQASLDGLMTNYGSDIRSTSLLIPTADVLQLNTTPQTIVAAQGAGTVIEVVSAFAKIDFNSVAYATNTNMYIQSATATAPQGLTTINSTVSQINRFRLTDAGGAALTQILENQDLQITVATGDPTAGDSDITVYVLYRVVTL